MYGRTFYGRSRTNVHEADLERLSEAALDGRQMKNVIKMASLLSRHESETLNMEHLESMLEAVEEIKEEQNAATAEASLKLF